MATPIEEIGLILSTLRRLTQGESLPRHESDDLDALLRSIKRTVERRDADEFGQIGRACLWLLLECATASLVAERATTLARLAQSSKPDDQGLH
jgi:hypothetical protein